MKTYMIAYTIILIFNVQEMNESRKKRRVGGVPALEKTRTNFLIAYIFSFRLGQSKGEWLQNVL